MDKTLKELTSKYALVMDGMTRYYYLDFDEKIIGLDGVTPYRFTICKKHSKHVIKEHSWVHLIVELFNYLQRINPKQNKFIMSFGVDWTDTKMFSETKLVNHFETECGLYINCNHTATHSYWLIQELLDFYFIDSSDCSLLVHRPTNNEPSEVLNYFKNEMMTGFRDYLISDLNKTEKSADSIINSIDYFSSILRKMKTCHIDFFAIDSNTIFSNYKSKFLLELNKYVSWPEEKKKVAKAYLDYLSSYRTFLQKSKY